ncbi:MAG: proprotein convertase P-domain-containing protein [Bacteroidota bacterium]
MKKKNFTNQSNSTALRFVFSMMFAVFALIWVNAQGTFQGNATNTAGNSAIPSAGTGGCTLAPQNAGGTVFLAPVTCVGTLGGGVVVESVRINLTHTFTADLEIYLVSPSGEGIELVTDLGGGGDNFTNTVFSDGAAGFIAGAAPFTGTFRPEGRNNTVTCNSTAGTLGTFTLANAFTGSADGDWQLVIFDDAGGDVGNMLDWEISFAGVTVPACTFVGGPTLPALSLSTSATNCESDPIAVPATTGDCTGLVLEYSVNGGTFEVATPGGTIPGLAFGNSTITWRASNACLQVSTATQEVTVADAVDPQIFCPPNTTLNLSPGECSTFFNYNVDFTDNCPFEGPSGTLGSTPGNSNNGNAAGGLVFFDLVNETSFDMIITGMSASIDGATNIDVYTKSGTGFGFEQNAGAWTLASTGDASAGPFGGGTTTAPFAVNFTIPPGVSGVALHVISTTSNYNGVGTAGSGPYGGGANSVFTDGALTIRCGASSNTFFASAPFNVRRWIGSATYETAAGGNLVQTQGLPSGSEFPIGTTTNCFEVDDAAGNIASCCFDVTVEEFPNATQNLTCNDNVQISLDENCSATVGADMILEGGPYGCYETRYTVNVLDPLGGIVPQPLGASAIGPVWTVKVIDNETGQSCWGSIVVEDKLPPVLECRDLTIACTEPLPSEPAPAFVGPNTMVIENINEPLGEPGAPVPDVHSYDFDYSFYPPGTPTEDVDVIVELIEHTWLPDLDIVATNPGGTQVDVFQVTGCFGAEFPIDCIFDDEGSGGLTMCADLDADGARLQCLVAPGVQQNDVLEAFDGEDAGGIWSLTYTDNATPDDGIIITAGLIVTANAPAVVPTDNCSNVTVEVEESFIDDACGGPAGQVIRTWTATDASGNSSNCTQVITYERPAVADVDIPQDIKWTCTQYDIFPNVTEATPVHPFIVDCDAASDLLDATCYNPSCDDLDFSFQDNPGLNSTATSAGGCPGFGLDDADVLAITGSGYPTVNGFPLVSICEIGVEYEDIVVQECVGTFKIVRQWTIIDWCSNPIDVRQENQIIKVVDEEAPIIELFGVDGEIESQYGNSQIPALGNLGNPNTTGGCGQAPQNTGGTVYTALVELPGSGAQFNPDQFTNLELESVLLSISHQHVEDLDIFLKGPSNKVIELSTDNGINGVGYFNTKFVDDPTVPVISAANSPFTGKYRPEGTDEISCGGFNGTVATLDDMITSWQTDALGTWELIIFDDNQDNIGEMVEWKLNFSFGDVTIDVYDASASGSIHTVCEGSVLVPPIQDCVDNCSGVDQYITQLWTVNNGTPEFQIGTIDGNGGYFFDVPLFQNGLPARYVVRYFAIDGCKNQAFVDMNIRLRDKVPPVAICDEITEIAITNNGQGTGSSCSNLHASDLDDGSYDNCSPVYFLMAKMDDSFSQDIYNRCYYPTRDFCCEDVGEQTVILLVLDQDPTPLFNTTITSASLGCDQPTPNTPSLFLPPNGINNTIPGTQNLVPVNFNTCMVTVQVTDKLPPVLVNCPANERISCDLYASNFETQLANASTPEEECAVFNVFGEATYFDNCVANVTCTVTPNLDQCLEGTIRRTWTATDDAGNTNSSQNCNQTIFVDHVSDFVVEFPQNRDGTPGHLPAIECGDDVPDFGEPEIFYETCELVAVSFEDEVFTDVDDACYKIVRQWTVINWCVVGDEIDQEVEEDSELAMRLANCLSIINLVCDLDGDGDCDDRTFRDSWAICNLPDAAHANDLTNPDTDLDDDPWDGFITYQQVIKVNDTVDPVFTNGCAIPDVCISDNTCAATVLIPTPDIDECSDFVTWTYEIEIGGTTLNGAGPYLNVAPGQYPVRYVAMDNCNNQTACETVLNVVDCKKPTPYCKAGIVVELMVVDPAMVEVWASDLDDNSFDNCPGALKFSFSADVDDIGRTFTCDDLGQNEVEMWVTDAAGNQDFCITSVVIQANMEQCEDDPLIAGQTATEQGEGVQNVTVNINSPGGFDANVSTDASGNFVQAVPQGGDYTVTPVHDVNPLNGVTTFDLVVISKHILGVDLLDSPYQIIAADANKSNSVTTFDMVEIRKLILFINTEFPNNTSWRFVDKDFTFTNTNNPFATSFPEVININNLNVSQLANDFVAIKVGDVNGSAAVNFADAEDRTMVGDLVLNADDAVLNEGETYTVEFKATEFAVTGYQFTLNFDNDALTFDGIAPALADAANFGTTMVDEGVITTSWNSNETKTLATDDVVFGLTFTAKQSGRLSDMLSINSRYTVAEAYTAEAELLNVALSFNNTVAADGFELYQNTPNPFASNTVIGFYLPEATSATLTISDVQGKVVKVIDQEFVKGYNQVELMRSDLGATGVLYYRLDTDTDSATRMMILVD